MEEVYKAVADRDCKLKTITGGMTYAASVFKRKSPLGGYVKAKRQDASHVVIVDDRGRNRQLLLSNFTIIA